VERRMRNLKSDLPIRPIYLHRDDAIVALCFVSVVALMVYTLIERDCQANPVLAEVGLRTTDQVLAILHGFCLTVYLTPSGHEVFWLDTSTESQALIWRQLQIPDPGTRLPTVRPASQEADSAEKSASFFALKVVNKDILRLVACSPMASVLQICLCWMYSTPLCWVGKVLLRSYLFCYAENEDQT